MILFERHEERRPVKPRLVTVVKQAVLDDIDLLTYKWMETSGLQSAQERNAVASDTFEPLDGRIITRFVEFRDAKLRRLIPYALADVRDGFADDINTLESDKYIYRLCVDADFNDNLLEPLAEYFHRFLVWGTLYDWYGAFNHREQAVFYLSELQDIEDVITDTLRTPSTAKRPMQPFGPAEKIY